jgi:CBS domain-containing protein
LFERDTMRVRAIMRRRPPVVTPGDRVSDAAELMHYGSDACVLVVSDLDEPRLVGVITARDIASRCVARHHQCASCLVRDHMTPLPLQTVGPGDELAEVARKMEAAEVRRIPVVTDDGMLLGVVREADLWEKVNGKTQRHRSVRVPSRAAVPRSGVSVLVTGSASGARPLHVAFPARSEGSR